MVDRLLCFFLGKYCKHIVTAHPNFNSTEPNVGVTWFCYGRVTTNQPYDDPYGRWWPGFSMDDGGGGTKV